MAIPTMRATPAPSKPQARARAVLHRATMERTKPDKRRVAARPTRNTDTVKVVRGDAGEPRLPHELDESADSQRRAATQPSDIGRKAFDDVRAGRVDTDRGPVLEELFARHGPQGGRTSSRPAPRSRKR
jgi:hypothetical protein